MTLTIGSRAQVWHGTAKKTSGGLTKSDLVKNKHGRIVSRKMQQLGHNRIQTLVKYGYIPVKGKFTLFRKTLRRHNTTPGKHYKTMSNLDNYL